MDNIFKSLIKKVEKVAELKLKQGIQLRTLALSMEQNKNEKTLKEWRIIINDFLDRLERGTK